MTFRQRFRLFRHSRPFWGAVLAVLSGLQIFVSMNLDLTGGTIAIGGEVFTGYLISFVLVLCGALALAIPAQRHFYGLVAVFVAIYSLIGVNLGGFFIGMLLGVTGGSLIFAWSPTQGTGDDEPDPKASTPRHAAAVLIAVMMSASLLTAIVGSGLARAEPCDRTVTPSPSPSTAAEDSGGAVGSILDLLGRILGGGGGNTPSPSSSPSPSPSPCATTKPAPSSSKKPTVSPSPTGTPGKVVKAANGQPDVARRPSRMTGSRVTMVDLVYKNVVDLPTAEGTIRVLHFTMSRSDTRDFLLHVPGGDGWDLNLKSSNLRVTGGVVHFYTSRFCGNLFGLLPVCYTPTSPPPPIPLPRVVFTNPDVQLVWVDSPVLEAPDLRTTIVRS